MDDPSMKDWLSIAIAFAAFVLSAISVWLSYKRSGKAEQVSVEALETAKKANDIASEALFQFPIVSVNLIKEPPVFDRSCESSEIILEILNRSDILISGSVVKIIPLTGFIYKKDPYDEVANFPAESVKYNFPEVLMKNGVAHINIAPFLLSIIKSNIREFQCPDTLYYGTFNIVVSPIQEGKEVGVSTRYYGSKDYSILNVNFIPSFIGSLPPDEHFSTIERRIKVFAGWPDDSWG